MRIHVLESTFISFTHSLLRYFILPHLVEDCRARKTACLPPHAAARASSRAPGSSSGATQPRLLHSSPFHSRTPCFFFFYCLSLSLDSTPLHACHASPAPARSLSLSSKQKWREMRNKRKSESISSNNLLIQITLLPGSLAALTQERC